MATLRWLPWLALAACSDLQGLGGPVPPLVTFEVEVTGDLAAVRPPGDLGTPSLHVALVWGMQWLTEALCLEAPGSPLPIDSRDDATSVLAALAAGCRDPFSFVPARVAANVPVELGVPTTIDLLSLPGADVLVGDVTARVAYASLVVYDDRSGNGSLGLARPNRIVPTVGDQPPADPTPVNQVDVVYGASFLTMTAPDQRIAYREGAFATIGAFYPRQGCGDPPPAFSVLAAGGFSAADAIAATLANRLPAEDPATCAESAPSNAVVTIPVRPPGEVFEVACTERTADSSVRYREPDVDVPDFTNRLTACVHLPSFGTPSEVVELIVTGRSDDACKGLTHYVLKGCREDPACGSPDWDHSLAPPAWWPCP